jgi:hypothetical protein
MGDDVGFDAVGFDVVGFDVVGFDVDAVEQECVTPAVESWNHPPDKPLAVQDRKRVEAHSPELTVHLGRYLPKTATCKKCGATWTTNEEKESDVALAVQIVQDAGLGAYDQALVVSADSDMCPAIRAAKTVARARDIVAVFPPKRSSMDVRNTADRTLKIFEKVPRRHQLSPVVVAPDGSKYTRPPYWV